MRRGESVRKPERKRQLGSPGVEGKILLKLVFKKWDDGMDSIDLAKDRDRWLTIVYAVINLRVA
jgi:hypothetical protein